MSICKERKKEIIAKYGKNPNDTGSTAVQIAILTVEIENLKEHLLEHKKDHSSRRGILLMVAKRRKLLAYLKQTNPELYQTLIQDLELRK